MQDGELAAAVRHDDRQHVEPKVCGRVNEIVRLDCGQVASAAQISLRVIREQRDLALPRVQAYRAHLLRIGECDGRGDFLVCEMPLECVTAKKVDVVASTEGRARHFEKVNVTAGHMIRINTIGDEMNSPFVHALLRGGSLPSKRKQGCLKKMEVQRHWSWAGA